MSSAPELLYSATGGFSMLLTIAIILLILWALGLFAFHVTSGLIHIVIVVAIIVAILHFVRGGRRV
jgi:hypothetical protein